MCPYSALNSITSLPTAGMGLEDNNLIGEVTEGVCSMVNDNSVDVWADCADEQAGQTNSLFCSCCSVCCPSEQCSL
jgi:hypothetical protein